MSSKEKGLEARVDNKACKRVRIYTACLTGITALMTIPQEGHGAMNESPQPDQCIRPSESAKEVEASLSGIDTIVVRTGPSELRIVGDPSTIHLDAVASTCDRDKDAAVVLEARRDGSRLLVDASFPADRGALLGASTDLRVTLEVPKNARIEIEETKGPVVIAGISGVTVRGGVGTLQIKDIEGDVIARNGLGAAYLRGITGDVHIEDGSGELIVSGVGGTLRIIADAGGQIVVDHVDRDVLIDADGSGEIRVTAVSGDVRIGKDGSGDVVVRRIGGSLTIAEKSRGVIRYEEIAGSVEIPSLQPVARVQPRR